MRATPIQISDVDLARLWARAWQPEAPCEMQAPCARVTWDGRMATARPTGTPISEAARLIAPHHAQALMDAAAMATRPVTPAPTIAALEADYTAATGPFAPHVAAEAVFRSRLAACRACDLWRESHFQGRGRCDSARCHCTKRYPWMAGESCPESLWKSP
ncbi:MAG: hypothetical protein ACO1TE_29080 [Prosthecobacter sp.]